MSPASPSRVIKVRPAEILSGRRTFDDPHGLRSHGDAGDHAQVGPRFRGAGYHPAIPCVRREPRVPARVGEEDGGARPVWCLRPREIRRGGPRHDLLCDHDRGALPRRCERWGDRGRVQRARLRAPPAVRDGRAEAAAMRTTAEIKGNEWVLNGTKSFATNASVAKVVIGYARTGRQKHEISAFIIPTDAEGFSVLKKEDKMGIRASDTVSLGFDGMRIPKENLLGDLHKGFNIAMATLDGGRIGIAAQALGIAQRALDESVKYAKERDAFGQKIADFQAIQWKVADMATEIEAARLLTYRAAQLEDLGRRHTYESSVAKLFASEAAHRAVDSAVQIHGGYGFIKDYVVEKLYRDQRVTEIYEGTSEIQRLVIARAVLGR